MAASSLQTEDVLEARDVKALTQKMSVLPDVGWARGARGLYLVVTESGASYRVDVEEDRCSCPDQFWRGGSCKHTARVAFATGRREIPDWVIESHVDEQLGEHVDGGDQA